MEKHSESRLSYLFAHLHLLSSDLLSSDSSHLCFSTVHIVGSFTSKLPSMIMTHIGQMTGQVMNPTMDMMETILKVIGTIGLILFPLRN